MKFSKKTQVCKPISTQIYNKVSYQADNQVKGHIWIEIDDCLTAEVLFYVNDLVCNQIIDQIGDLL